MAFNAENYRRIRADYETKYKRAQDDADRRRELLHQKVPGVREIDNLLSRVGLDIMQAIVKGGSTTGVEVDEIRRRNLKLQARRAELLRQHGYPEDYSDVKYECPLCSDSGYVDGKMCSCMKKELVMAGCESSGMGHLMRTQSFDNFSLDYYARNKAEYGEMERNLSVALRFSEGFAGRGSGNLLLMGGTGLGKTHLCSAMARVIIERGYDVYYTGAQGMISDFERERFGNSSGGLASGGEDTSRYFECDLLIIDDLGTEVTNQFTVACLFNIINTRLSQGMPTIINTNLSAGDMKARYSDRIVSRLLGEYRTLRFVGHDVRAQKLAKK